MEDFTKIIRDILRRLEILEIHTGDEDYIAPTFSGTWVNEGTTYNDAGYYRERGGRVHLKGVIKSGTINTTAFTLPTGYRPSRRQIFIANTNTGIGRLDVDTNGNVIPVSGGTTWFSLDGLSFRV